MKDSDKYLISIASGFVLSGIYLLYKASSEFFKFNEVENEKVSEIDSTMCKISNYYEKYLSKIKKCNNNYVNLTLKNSIEIEELLSIISKNIEEELTEFEKENREKRISCLNLNDDFEYAKNIEKLCQKRNKICLIVKDTLIDQYKSKVKNKYIQSNENIEINIYSMIKSANMKNVEKIMKTIYLPSFGYIEEYKDKYSDYFIIPKENCEEALNYYKDCSIKLISEYKMTKTHNSKYSEKDDLNNKHISEDLLIIKTKMEDLLFIKFGVTFTQLEFLIDFYGLSKKESIKEILSVVKY